MLMYCKTLSCIVNTLSDNIVHTQFIRIQICYRYSWTGKQWHIMLIHFHVLKCINSVIHFRSHDIRYDTIRWRHNLSSGRLFRRKALNGCLGLGKNLIEASSGASLLVFLDSSGSLAFPSLNRTDSSVRDYRKGDTSCW